MTALTRWEPFKTHWDSWKELEEMEKRLSTYFGRRQFAPVETRKR